jgi:predicted KAP-like P-loop ATPase
MADVFAKDATLRDDRVQAMAFSGLDNQTYYLESHRAGFEGGSAVAGSVQDLKKQVEAGKIDMATYDKAVARLQEADAAEYLDARDEAQLVMDDAAKTVDERAAAEIVRDVADKKFLEKEKEEAGISIKFPKWADHYESTFRLKLVKTDKTVDKKKQEELDRRILKEEDIQTKVGTKYSKTITFGDKLLEAVLGAAKKLASPVEKTAKAYGSL